MYIVLKKKSQIVQKDCENKKVKPCSVSSFCRVSVMVMFPACQCVVSLILTPQDLMIWAINLQTRGSPGVGGRFTVQMKLAWEPLLLVFLLCFPGFPSFA